MADESKPFQPPIPSGVNPTLPPGQIMPAGKRGEEMPIADLTKPTPQPTTPIGVGHVITDSHLLPSEKAVLEKMGWKEGDPIPTNLAKLLQASAGTDPTAVELPTSSSAAERSPMPPEEVARGANILSDAKDALHNTETLIHADPSVQRAIAAAAGTGDPDVNIVDDTKDPKYDGGEEKKPEAGFDPPLVRCPHCEWDLRIRDPIEVTDADKQRFLQGILGQVPFQKKYDVFGGAISTIYRSLTPEELDMCFEQAYRERQQGKYQSPDAYFEVINRYRLSLQLVSIVNNVDVTHIFPQNIDDWEKKLNSEKSSTGDLVVKRICEFMFKEVIRTESLNRVLGGLGGQFNSLVAKLEANSHNSDFWSTTKSAT